MLPQAEASREEGGVRTHAVTRVLNILAGHRTCSAKSAK